MEQLYEYIPQIGDIVSVRLDLDDWMYEHLKENFEITGVSERLVVSRISHNYGGHYYLDLNDTEEYRPYPWYKKKLFVRSDWVKKDEFLTAVHRANLDKNKWRRWFKEKFYLAFRMGT